MLNYKIYNNRQQENDWVICIHGLGGSSNVWYKQVKEYRKHFNVLLIDLRGHGKSKDNIDDKYTFNEICNDIVAVMDHLKIQKAHLAGISLGSLIANAMSIFFPQKVKSMVLGGTVTKIDFKSRLAINVGGILITFMSYMFLYSLCSFVIMPRKKQRHSRKVFVKEATKLGKEEFIKWYKMLKDLSEVNLDLEQHKKIPKLYIVGSEDYAFANHAKKEITRVGNVANLHIIEKCGHVCNIEKFDEFNKVSVEFIKKHV